MTPQQKKVINEIREACGDGSDRCAQKEHWNERVLQYLEREQYIERSGTTITLTTKGRMRSFLIEVPIKAASGSQVFRVDAESEQEAKDLVIEGEGDMVDSDVEVTDLDMYHAHMTVTAILETDENYKGNV